MVKLRTILKVRQRAEEAAARKLHQLRTTLTANVRQADELRALAETYRQEHEMTPPSSADALKHFRQFYAQLHVAVSSQEGIVEQLTQSLEDHQREFRERHKDRRSLQHLIKERELMHKKQMKRSERKVIDGLYPRRVV